MDPQKLEHFLRLMLLEVFKIKVQALSLKACLPPDTRQGLDDAMRDIMKYDVDDMLVTWLRQLRGEPGENQETEQSDKEADPWQSFRDAEARAASTDLFEKEWRKLWDAL